MNSYLKGKAIISFDFFNPSASERKLQYPPPPPPLENLNVFTFEL